ncbi:MAG: efflux RND transporter periplasmic adaptor subunit [Proteobacteria bacterium]|nr:efflux RND transporter periplasmic adaptor subunit [Pseudomonadota bacterium]
MKKRYKIIIQIVLVVSFIICGIGGCVMLRASRKSLSRVEVTRSDPLARVIVVEAKNIFIPIQGHGTVRPLHEIKLVPQVAGKITMISSQLVDGGTYKKGDLLAQIDPADYDIAVTLAEARVQDALSKFILKEQETDVAISDWKLLHPGTPVPTLVAKEHQLDAAKANLGAARAEMEKAKLNLFRTRLTAPFNGRISQKNVDIDQYVSPGQSVAVLYGTDAVEIMVPLESKYLIWFDVPGFTSSETQGSNATVTADLGGLEQVWSGKVVRTEGTVNEKTRMVNVVVRVANPFDRFPPLAPGFFVKVDIQGKSVENGIVIPRASLQDNNVVWVVDQEEKLRFRPVEIAVRTHEGLVVGNGLSSGDKVVVAAIKDATNGMKVKSVLVNNGGAEQ